MTSTIKSGLLSTGRQKCQTSHSCGPNIRKHYIIHYVISGKGTFICNGEKFNISSGESFLIRPFDMVLYFPDINDPWEYTWINFNGEKYDYLLNKINYIKGNCIMGFIKPEKILPLFDFLLTLDTIKNTTTANNIMQAIISAYADYFPINIKNTADSHFDLALILIESNFHKTDFDTTAICEALKISRITLYRCFVKNCKSSPAAYLTKYRVERAKELLEHNFSVKITSVSVGFSDPLYFSKVFKSFVGIPPSKYKIKFKI